MLRLLSAVPKFTVTALIILAIVNLLVGVILRYFVGAITDWLDVDPVPFTWVEEVGELSLAWLTLIGAAIGIQSRSHFMLTVFALGVAGIAGLWIGGYPMQQLSSALVSGSQSWVLLAIPAFVFAGNLMERCGMSHALVELARALIGWVKGGLGMSVIVVADFFFDIFGSEIAEVSALGSALMPPMTKAGYDRRDSASLIAAGTAMGMLVPPAIFMIVIAQVTNTSAVALFLRGFIPAATIMGCLMGLVYFRAPKNHRPVANRPNPPFPWASAQGAAPPLG